MHWLRWDDVAESEWISSVARPASALRQVVHDLAVSSLTAGARARVLAFVPDARPVGRAVGVDRAFWTTALVGVADVLRQAGACTSAVLLAAHCVGAARRRLARVEVLLHRRLLDDGALHEGVPGVARHTQTARRVAHDAALGVLAASSWTGVSALVADAGQVLRALAVGHALGTAVGRCSHEARVARAGRLVARHAALGVRAAG